MKNEKTSPRVSRLASKILNALQEEPRATGIWLSVLVDDKDYKYVIKELCTVDELQAVLSSALTQAPDRKKKDGKK